MLKLHDKENTQNNYSLSEEIKLNNLSIKILYNDEIDHEKELENLLKEKEISFSFTVAAKDKKLRFKII